MAPLDPLYNARDAASRELIQYGIIYDCFATNFPLLGLLRQSGVAEILFQGTGILRPFIYDVAYGAATQPGDTITPRRKQMATNSKFDIRFYQANLPVEQTVNKLFNAPGDTQIFSQEDLDTYCLTMKLEMMLEMDAYRHGQPAAGNPGGTSGVADDRHLCINGLDEGLNNGIDPSPFGNVYTLYGSITRNGVTGQAYNSTPYYCGTAAGAASSITFPILQRALAQLSTIGARAKVGFTSPFGWGALAVMFRTSSWVNQAQVVEGYDFGWRSVDFGGLKVHEDPLCPSSVTYNYLPGGNPAAYGTASLAKYLDGAGSNTKLSPFTSPTYTLNGAAVTAGTLSPTGSQIPSATVINPGEVLYIISPEAMDMLPAKPGSGWNMDTRITQIPDNVSTDNRFLKQATNIITPQPPHGMEIFGFKGVGS
jgi:hypothetical protein